jgi:hypothetical protein
MRDEERKNVQASEKSRQKGEEGSNPSREMEKK